MGADSGRRDEGSVKTEIIDPAHDWPATDSRLNYTEALAEIRRRKLLAGEVEPVNDEEREMVK